MLLGRVIDSALATGPSGVFAEQLAADRWRRSRFFLLVRPVIFGLSAATNAVAIGAERACRWCCRGCTAGRWARR